MLSSLILAAALGLPPTPAALAPRPCAGKCLCGDPCVCVFPVCDCKRRYPGLGACGCGGAGGCDCGPGCQCGAKATTPLASSMSFLSTSILENVYASPPRGKAAAPIGIGGNLRVQRDHLAVLAAQGVDESAAVDWEVDPELADDQSVASPDGRTLTFVAAPGTYNVRLTAFWVKDGKTYLQKARATVTVSEPTPPGPPVPPVPPVPPPGPSPFPADALRVLIVYQAGQPLPSGQAAVLTSGVIRDYLNAHCAKTNGFPDYRVWDADVPTGNDLPVFKAALERPRKSLPWVLVGGKAGGYEGPLPATVADTLALIQKYGG